MNRIRLIVNADDFGVSRGITDGIIVAHRYGVVTSASLVVNMPASEYAISRAREFPNLTVGIHLNVCQGVPILPAASVRTLVGEDGRFLSPRTMARRLSTFRIARGELEAEFRAQIRWAKDHRLACSHVDSHHHMHLYPAAARPFARAVQAEAIPCIRTCVCHAFSHIRRLGGPYRGSPLRRVCVSLYRHSLQHTVFRHFDSPDARISFPGLGSDKEQVRERFDRLLASLPSGIFELSCHPGLFERGFSETDAIRHQRETEMVCLADPALRRSFETRGIQLINYRDLRRDVSLASQQHAAAVA